MYLLISDPFCVEGNTQSHFCLTGDRLSAAVRSSPCLEEPSCGMGIRALVYSLKRSDDDRNCLMAEVSGMRIRNGRLEVSYGDMSPTALSCRDAKRRIRAKKYASGTQTGNDMTEVPLIIAVDEETFGNILNGDGMASGAFCTRLEELQRYGRLDDIIAEFPTDLSISESDVRNDPVCIGKLAFALAKKLTRVTTGRILRGEEESVRAEALCLKDRMKEAMDRCFELESDNRSLRSALAYYYYHQLCDAGLFIEDSREECFRVGSRLFDGLVCDPPEKSYKDRSRYILMRMRYADLSGGFAGDSFPDELYALAKVYEGFGWEEKRAFRREYTRVCYEFAKFVIDRRLYVFYNRYIKKKFGSWYHCPIGFVGDDGYDRRLFQTEECLRSAVRCRPPEKFFLPTMTELDYRFSQVFQINGIRRLLGGDDEAAREDFLMSEEYVKSAWDTYNEVRAAAADENVKYVPAISTIFPVWLIGVEARNCCFLGKYDRTARVISRNRLPSDAQLCQYAELLAIQGDFSGARRVLSGLSFRGRGDERVKSLVRYLDENDK